jgi:hypothetical protein
MKNMTFLAEATYKTEEEAKLMICPFALSRISASDRSCLGGKCMGWTWLESPEGEVRGRCEAVRKQ